MRGEYVRASTILSSPRELPPRARRIQHHENIGGVNLGTTSACAENTQQWDSKGLEHRNYLRVRGEYIQAFRHWCGDEELPPRARRIRGAPAADHCGEGTTSACAENTAHGSAATFATGNYLRVRGEYPRKYGLMRVMGELPPRARRIHPCVLDSSADGGTTSACAENTPHMGGGVAAGRNYLRVRGEYVTSSGNYCVLLELPPRARRILRTIKREWCDFVNYLRVRGEYLASLGDNRAVVELPPRARRILPTAIRAVRLRGTTSACAENTRIRQ